MRIVFFNKIKLLQAIKLVLFLSFIQSPLWADYTLRKLLQIDSALAIRLHTSQHRQDP